MSNVLKIGLEGRFKFTAVRPDGTERILADWHQNLILDSGLNRIGTGGCWDRCQVGTGTTTPAEGQTALAAPLATTSTVQGTQGGTDTPTNTYAWVQRVYRFGVGVAAGNLTEVGVGWATGLFSRTLIKDSGGTPTSITVLADEYLDVTYEIRAYPTMTDQTFSGVDISGTPYTFTVRPGQFSGNASNSGTWPADLSAMMSAGVTSVGGTSFGLSAYGSGAALAAVTGLISGTQTVSSSSTTHAFRSSYVENSFKREVRATFGLTAGTAPFGGFYLSSSMGTYQMVVSPNIPKDDTKVLTLDIDVSWARKAI